MASACHLCAAVLVHVARRRRLDSDLDERRLSVDTYSLRKVFKGILQDLKSPELSSLDLIKHEMSSKKE